jgi:hypothetical protein
LPNQKLSGEDSFLVLLFGHRLDALSADAESLACYRLALDIDLLPTFGSDV